ncbi:MAG: hypothetical protein HRU25_16780 [Psychrobium sp.]|nr:hypothetical protein [Psychrobium sp.]
MPIQDLLYSVLARPLGNRISKVKNKVQQVSSSNALKDVNKDLPNPPVKRRTDRRHRSNERRGNSRRNSNMIACGRRSADGAKKGKSGNKYGGLDTYA